jgi:hypothetical protein
VTARKSGDCGRAVAAETRSWNTTGDAKSLHVHVWSLFKSLGEIISLFDPDRTIFVHANELQNAMRTVGLQLINPRSRNSRVEVESCHQFRVVCAYNDCSIEMGRPKEAFPLDFSIFPHTIVASNNMQLPTTTFSIRMTFSSILISQLQSSEFQLDNYFRPTSETITPSRRSRSTQDPFQHLLSLL